MLTIYVFYILEKCLEFKLNYTHTNADAYNARTLTPMNEYTHTLLL
jgi:hypothetical protein